MAKPDREHRWGVVEFDPEMSLSAHLIIQKRCTTCHSSQPTDNVFTVAPAGVVLDSLADMKKWAPRIKARSIDSMGMPYLNKTKMTTEERTAIARWIYTGAAPPQ